MKFKAVIFDLDGTLLNSLEDIAGSVNKILATHCFTTHKLYEYKMFVGSGISELMTRALPEEERDPDTIDDYVKEFGSPYKTVQVVKKMLGILCKPLIHA